MPTSRRSKQPQSPRRTSGLLVGRAKTSAMQTRSGKGSKEKEAGSFTTSQDSHQESAPDGSFSKTWLGSLARIRVKRLRQLSTSSKKSGIWGHGFRATLATQVFPTIGKEFSLLQLIDRKPPISSFLTAANATGILRRERKGGRTLDPIFEKGLHDTIRFWCNVGEALGIQRHEILAPRFALKRADIKAAIATDRFSVARNLTWDECEMLMGFPEGWTAVEGDSLATPSRPPSRNGSGAKSSKSSARKR